MKFYSENLKTLFDTVEDLEAAEKEYQAKLKAEQEKKNERKTRAKEVEDARVKYMELLRQFIADYGSYHSTVKEGDNDLFTLIDMLFK
jgi:septation ring formation regulator EzrA